MSYCRVSTCYNRKDKGSVRFFAFPRDPTLCEQWVEFCCCAQTAETFYTGGVFALKSSYLICGDHFEAGAFLSPPARLLLVPGAVPRLKPGRTLPTGPTEVLGNPAEFGFIEEKAPEVVVKQEDEEVGAPEPTEIVRVLEEDVVVKEEIEEVAVIEVVEQEGEEEQVQVLEATQFPDEVLVEMLDPEEIKEEILPEFEEVEPVMMEELPSNECEIIELEEVVEIINRPQHRSDCIFATGKLSNFEERYKRQIRQNKNTESQIELEKMNYSQMAEKCRKANELLAAKRRKKQQLQRKLKEYKRIGPEALLRSMESFNAKSCDEGSDSSVDEANAWW
ncbi:52 kDa repressor of the inhibitor of the protein kinase-like [Culex quinquefasciatus]|uniref:52 kDa repressor of the inhibitor of the protein kinase-like n=1 Tax=Culex quinquefasciatus TaxID=7176 RepID=UPI0018E3B98D|nr:52 kDa repressor of the inhibitor of the protein kinase-like [Culex quinquefasciatus]